MKSVTVQGDDLHSRLGLDTPTPLEIRREAARDLCEEIIRNLDNTSRAFEFSERAAFILFGDSTVTRPLHPRQTAHHLRGFLAG
jgi:hypothetical protein